ncbi:MAG: beta-galactosidase trimerization domain-containing protein [Kiritimatiellae bacterium]|nr:beta-galactosidase trimerization domain-containing protein [Kiritimatiellia bacterium]
MTDRREMDGFGYARTPYRVEHRPRVGPHTKAELLSLLDALEAAGTKAWWYSVAAKGSYPLFPSKVLPYRENAVDYYPWLVAEAHRRDIAIFSWEYLSTAPLLGAQKPEWRWRFFDWVAPRVERDAHFVCYNSPYGELMKQYTVEVVGDLGFDGVWFDGSFLCGLGGSGHYACCCDFCAAKYERETGYELPRTVDFRDLAFRRYLEWRYSDHTEYWRALSAYVRERVPKAIIAFNFFNRFGHESDSGSPLLRMAGDAPQGTHADQTGPMEAMISAERGSWPMQVLLMAKTLRAINDRYPVEIWAPAYDSIRATETQANPAAILFHTRTCATGGGFGSLGLNIPDNANVLAALSKAMDPVGPYVGGEQVAPVGLVLSGRTKDYAYIGEDDKNADPLYAGIRGPAGIPDALPVWRAVHGMHNLLNGLHWPSDVLLDNMLTQSFLRRYAAVVLPDVQCLSDAAARELARYVEEGGVLLATGETGLKTEWGEPRARGALDDLFGITWRDDAQKVPTLDVNAEWIRGKADAVTGLLDGGLPPVCRLSGLARLVRSDVDDVLVTGRYRLPGDVGKEVAGAAVLSRSLGRGRAFYIAPKIDHDYALGGPRVYSRNLVQRLLDSVLTPPFTTDAPPNVAITLWKQDNRQALHLLNVPSSLLIFPACGECNNIAPPMILPEDFVPTRPIVIALPGKWKRAFSPTNPERLTFAVGDNGIRLVLQQLDQHALVVVE